MKYTHQLLGYLQVILCTKYRAITMRQNDHFVDTTVGDYKYFITWT